MVVIANTKIMQNMLIWDINKTYDSNGTAVTLYKMLQDFQVKKPSGYRKEEVEEILATYQEKASTEETAAEKPNIIVIMNESFADMIQAYEL